MRQIKNSAPTVTCSGEYRHQFLMVFGRLRFARRRSVFGQRRNNRLAILLAWLAVPLALAARPKDELQNGQTDIDRRTRPSVRAYRVDTPPEIDGLVVEPIWTEMQPATGFIQQEPNNGEPSTEQTEVRIAFDDDNLYLGVICLDSQPDNIVVTQNRRDASLENTDSVEILFDTFNDKQNGFVFGTSPTGIEYDAQVTKAGQGRGGAGNPARAGGAGTTGGGAQRGGAAAVNINWDAVW
ncbi:MAG TPA: carbohydrate binding family 9 domain-containing protein, partial [Terriglobia bacterium]|nr:carbohydrate binding family 9 domain-containing protein [Terriglobia bacterium]